MPKAGPKCLEMDFLQEKVEGNKKQSAFFSHSNGKYVCGLPTLIQKGDACVVFSVGGANAWDFEVAVSQHTSCQIHTYDCTIVPRIPAALKGIVNFHKTCVGNKNEVKAGQKYATFDKLMEEAGISDPPDIWKMDVEGFEYQVLRSLASDSNAAARLLPRFILLEIHATVRKKYQKFGLSWADRTRQPGEIAAALLPLFTVGYRLSNIDWSTSSPYAIEVVLSRIYC